MTSPPYDVREGLRLAEAAFQAACARFVESRFDIDGAFASSGEALLWAASLDEGYSELLGETYETARDSSAEGRILPGVRWARNRVAHQQALTLTKVYGSELGHMVLGESQLGVATHMIWRSADELPPGRNDRG
ncbi:hypothetical protein [Micromonospora sp. NPDC000442]|uniref:hypothetical protein n=1 Tax=Micromonospora sp. NPDC000442 TaxID=3364217 RepID=UPI0036B63CAF